MLFIFVEKQAKRPFLKRYLKRDDDEKKIAACDKALETSLSKFSVSRCHHVHAPLMPCPRSPFRCAYIGLLKNCTKGFLLSNRQSRTSRHLLSPLLVLQLPQLQRRSDSHPHRPWHRLRSLQPLTERSSQHCRLLIINRFLSPTRSGRWTPLERSYSLCSIVET